MTALLATYRPTVTPEGSAHVDTFTGTTSSFSCTSSGILSLPAVVVYSNTGVRNLVPPGAILPVQCDALAGRAGPL